MLHTARFTRLCLWGWLMSGSVSWIQNHWLPPHGEKWSSANLKGVCFSTSCFLSSFRAWIQSMLQPAALYKPSARLIDYLNPKITTSYFLPLWSRVKGRKWNCKIKGNLILFRIHFVISINLLSSLTSFMVKAPDDEAQKRRISPLLFPVILWSLCL